ncbi:MAG: hypothetical protein ABI847_00075 [Anaerolineales bacterium]
MSNMQSVNIIKRPWYEWVLWAVWFVADIFVLQNALASGRELEPRAATLFWITFVILLLGGGIVYFIRRARLLK